MSATEKQEKFVVRNAGKTIYECGTYEEAKNWIAEMDVYPDATIQRQTPLGGWENAREVPKSTTPAPWRQYAPDIDGVDENYRFVEGGEGGFPAGFHLSGFVSPEDAQLIATAPELLEEVRNAAANLETILDLIDGYVDVKDGDYGQPVANDAMRAKQAAEQSLDALQKIISKAEGRS